MRSTVLVASFLLLAACNQPAPLSANEKALYFSELIEKRAECDEYRTRLAMPALDMPVVEGAYAAALKAKCVNKDV